MWQFYGHCTSWPIHIGSMVGLFPTLWITPKSSFGVCLHGWVGVCRVLSVHTQLDLSHWCFWHYNFHFAALVGHHCSAIHWSLSHFIIVWFLFKCPTWHTVSVDEIWPEHGINGLNQAPVLISCKYHGGHNWGVLKSQIREEKVWEMVNKIWQEVWEQVIGN